MNPSNDLYVDSNVMHTNSDGSVTVSFQGFEILAVSYADALVQSDEYDANYVRFDSNTTVHFEDATHDILVTGTSVLEYINFYTPVGSNKPTGEFSLTSA